MARIHRRGLFKRPENRTPRTEIVGRSAGRAGMLASVAMAFFGVALGALAAFVGGQGQSLQARYSGFDELSPAQSLNPRPERAGLRQGRTSRDALDPPYGETILRAGTWRDDIVQDILDAPQSTQIKPGPPFEDETSIRAARPRIAIVFDDMGLDQAAFDELINLPGPVTFSFLPYANNSGEQALVAAARGDTVMLHLPMEPVGAQDPGPHALKVGGSAQKFNRDLTWNLDQLTGYSGANNHMGSRFTTNRARMTKVLSKLHERNVYFLDSVTTPKSVAQSVARDTGTLFIRRDVFLDPKAGRDTVKRQLAQTEEIARRTGYAVAIAHPRADTISMIGPWLASASARGFELVTMDQVVGELYDLDGQAPIARQAPISKQHPASEHAPALRETSIGG